jgi:hypothetical protein
MTQDDPEMRISLIPILKDESAGLAAIAAAAAIIAADARFNLWLARGGKKEDGNRMLELMARYEDIFQTCHSALRKFRQDADRGEFARALAEVERSLVKITGGREVEDRGQNNAPRRAAG